MPINVAMNDHIDVPALDICARGQAALLLVESLIHVLVERSILTASDAADIVVTALEVQADVAEAANGDGAKMWESYQLLERISGSLQHTVRRPDGPSH